MESQNCLDLVEKPEAWRAQLCSCTQCDSYNCFALRYHSGAGCSCRKCEHSKTCIFYKILKHNLSSPDTCKSNVIKEKKEILPNTCSYKNKASLSNKKDPSIKMPDGTNENKASPCNKREHLEIENFDAKNRNKPTPCHKQEHLAIENLDGTNNNKATPCNKQEDSAMETSDGNENSNILNMVTKIISNESNKLQKDSEMPTSSVLENNTKSNNITYSEETHVKIIDRCADNNKNSSCNSVKKNVTTDDKENDKCDMDMDIDISESKKTDSAFGLDDKSKTHKLEKIKVLKQGKGCKCEECRSFDENNKPTTTALTNRIVITHCAHKHNRKKPCNGLKESIEKEIVYEYDKEKKNTKKTSREHKIVHHRPTVACCVPQNTSAKLSAQVMNVPYQEYQKTINQRATPNESKPKKCFDIFQKIKEIYNACTCKVCECISSVVPNVLKQNCNCKPCDCEDCRNLNSINLQFMRNLERKQCKICTALSNNFECEPNKCKNYRSMMSNPCDCNLCECIECVCLRIKKRGNFIVAPVGEGTQQIACQCSPCGCFECAHPYGTITRTPVTHEMSTEMHRNLNCYCEACDNDHCEQEGADTCNCDRHSKVMRKPVQKDSNDYDIRHCTIRSHNIDKCLCRKHKKENAVAMFATVPNAIFANNSIKNQSFCKYSFKKLSPNAVELSQKLTSLKINSVTKNTTACDCKPCDCKKCRKHYLEGHIASKKGCVCEICDCINCGTSRTFMKTDTQDICNCKPCECIECQSYNITRRNSINYVNRTRHENVLLNSESPCLSVISDRNNINSEQIISSLNTSDSGHFLNLILNDKEHKNQDPTIFFQKIIPKNNLDDYQLYCAVTEGTKYFTNSKDVVYSQIFSKPKSGQLLNNDTTSVNNDFKISATRKGFNMDKHTFQLNDEPVLQSSPNDASTESSGASTSGIPHTDEWSGETSTKIHETSKSRESSCNSSGHDNSDYLIRFPRSTVETCINDVMNLNMYKQSNLRGFIRPSIVRSKPSKDTDSSNASENNMDRLSFKRKQFDNHGISKTDTGRISYMKICKNWNSKNPCDCQPCDCDKCLYKTPKFNRCQCDCAACSCDGTCLNEDQTVFIRKNEITQTNEPVQDNGEDSWDSEYNGSSDIKTLPCNYNPSWTSPCNLEVTEDKENMFIKKSNVTFSDVPYDKTSKTSPFRNVNRAINSCLNTSLQIQPQDSYINYSSVKKTLTDARAFSMELLAVLQKYEKANQEFDSVSKKYKILNGMSLNNIPKDSKYNFSKEVKKLDQIISDADIAHNKLNNSKLTKTNLGNNLFLANEPVIIEAKNENNNKYEEVQSQDSYFNSIIKQNEQKMTECEQLDDKQDSFQTVDPTCDKGEGSKDIRVHDSVSQTEKLETKNIFDDKNPPEEVIKKENQNTKKLNDKKILLTDLKDQYKLYSKHINRAIMRCRRKNWNNCDNSELSSFTTIDGTSMKCKFDNQINKSNTETFIEEENPDENVEEQDSRQLNTVFISSVEQKDDISFNKNEDEIVYNTIKSLPLNEERYQTNGEEKYVTQKLGQKYSTQISEIPEDEGKKFKSNEVIESKGIFSKDYDQALTSQDEYSKANLRRCFESVPSMTLKRLGLPSDMKTKANPNQAIMSTCNLMKISFQTVRKVSDHTIIVKWKIPPVTTEILGYELLVDGRAVQKVLSPTRNMAVITCLPHSDKVFLTVRTITSKTTCGRYPSTTFVYRPRVK